MARSPKYEVPPGMEGKALAGVRPCGCITAALAISGPEDWMCATQKDVREFYADMGQTGREVRWMDVEHIRSNLEFNCPHREAVSSASSTEGN